MRFAHKLSTPNVFAILVIIFPGAHEEIQNQYEHKHSEVPELADLIKATLWKGRLSNQLERWNKLLLSSKGGN